MSLVVLLLVGVGIIIWRRRKRGYARKPGEVSFAPDNSVPKSVPRTPVQQHGRRESDLSQSESERRALLRLSTEGQLPIWEQRHTMPPLDSPPSLSVRPQADVPDSRRVYFRLPSGDYPGLVPDLPPIAETPVESSTGRRTLRHTSLPPPAATERKLPKTKGKNRASMPATSTASNRPTSDRDAQWIDLRQRPDLLPPMFLPPHLLPEHSRPQRSRASTDPVDMVRTSENATSMAGLSKFASDWRESVRKTTEPTGAIACTYRGAPLADRSAPFGYPS